MNKKLQNLIVSIKPSGFLDYKEFLYALYKEMKNTDKRYTYAKFAVDLGLPEGNSIYQIVKGRRPLTAKNAKKIIDSLKIKGPERRFLQTLVDYINSQDIFQKDTAFKKLYEIKETLLDKKHQKETLEYFSEWFYPVIGEVMKCFPNGASKEDVEGILRVKLGQKTVDRALSFLSSLGILDDVDGHYFRTNLDLSTGPETHNLAVASIHQEMLHQSAKALTEVAAEDRDVSAVTIAISHDKIGEVKALIHNLQQNLLQLESDNKNIDTVFQVNVQAFPFTRRIKENS